MNYKVIKSVIEDNVIETDDYLEHHGILGQKWGVRRYQNKDGSLTEEGKKHYGVKSINDIDILKKGTTLGSVQIAPKMKGVFNYKTLTYDAVPVNSSNVNSKNYQNSGRPMYTYLADNEHDNAVYKGPFAKFLKERLWYQQKAIGVIQEYKYTVIDDLAMPKKEERVNEFKKLLNDNKKSGDFIKELNSVKQQCINQRIGGDKKVEEWKNLDLNNLKTEKDWNLAYELFGHAMESAHAFKSTSEYMKNISSKYDAMIDDNNKDIYNGAQSPIVIFNAAKVLKDCGQTRIVDIQEINDNYEKIKQEMEKQGRRVML